jgi:hypothetical protein
VLVVLVDHDLPVGVNRGLKRPAEHVRDLRERLLGEIHGVEVGDAVAVRGEEQEPAIRREDRVAVGVAVEGDPAVGLAIGAVEPDVSGAVLPDRQGDVAPIRREGRRRELGVVGVFAVSGVRDWSTRKSARSLFWASLVMTSRRSPSGEKAGSRALAPLVSRVAPASPSLCR